MFQIKLPDILVPMGGDGRQSRALGSQKGIIAPGPVLTLAAENGALAGTMTEQEGHVFQFSGLSEVGMPCLEHIPTLIKFNSILKLLDCTEPLRTPFSAAPDFELHVTFTHQPCSAL